MLAICRSNIGDAIPSSERYLGETNLTDYSPLIVGESYLVHALLFIFDRVDFLVGAPEQPPFRVPSNLFDLVDARVPAGWKMCITQSHADYRVLFDEFKIKYIIEYPLLVNECQHYLGLVERDPREAQRFMERKLECKLD